jgi:hypothetical protein
MRPDILAQLTDTELGEEMHRQANTIEDALYLVALYEERARRVALLNQGWRNGLQERSPGGRGVPTELRSMR